MPVVETNRREEAGGIIMEAPSATDRADQAQEDDDAIGAQAQEDDDTIVTGVPRFVAGVSTCSGISAMTKPARYPVLLPESEECVWPEAPPSFTVPPQPQQQPASEKKTLSPPTTTVTTCESETAKKKKTLESDSKAGSSKPGAASSMSNSKVESSKRGIDPGEDQPNRPRPRDGLSLLVSDLRPMPGAYSLRPGGGAGKREDSRGSLSPHPEEEAASPLQQEEEGASSPEALDDGSGLTVANLVSDCFGSESAELSVAVPQDLARKGTTRTTRFQTYPLLGAILLIVALVVVVPCVVVTKNNDNGSPTPAAPTKDIPTSSEAPPPSLEDSILSLLPEKTVDKIFSGKTDSPQARAFDWLMQDSENLPSLSPERIQQKFALAVFYWSTNGPAWTINTHWLNHSVHECNWYNKPDFAMRDQYSLVLPTYLPKGYLEPPPLRCDYGSGLYHHFWLDTNNLRGRLPEEFYLLTSLKTVSFIANAGLGGTLSTRVSKLASLEGLYLGPIMEGTIPSEIGLLSRLRFFSSNLGGTIPSEMWRLSDLDTLIAVHNPMLTGSIPSEVGLLRKLRQVWIGGTGLTGTIPTEIGLATSLLFLVVDANKMTGTLPTELGHLSDMTCMSFLENLITGTIPSQLGNFHDSYFLSLRDNQLSGSLPSELGLLTSLAVTLNVRNNNLTGTIPSELGLLPTLQEIDLISNKFSGQIPSEFGQLSSMGHLNFANNSFSGTVPWELSALRESLHTLRLENNPLLSGALPDGICNITGTCFGNMFDACEPPFGFIFDCTGLLCGCGCDCLNN